MLKQLQELVLIGLLTFKSLTHNSCKLGNYYIDAAFEPVYWFVDNVAGFMGQVFVVLVTLLTTTVVVIWYSYLLPIIMTFNQVWIGLHITVAHWLLINIVFHYFKAVFTSPGCPPQVYNQSLQELTTALFTVFDQEKRFSAKSFLHILGLGGLVQGIVDATGEAGKIAAENRKQAYRKHPGGWENPHGYEHLAIIYLFLLCSAVSCALGLLNMWHIYLISLGQTSIEVHVNSKEKAKAKKRGMGYHNPYDYNWKQNWKHLLGLYHNRSFLSVVLPSAHPPQGDGLSWPRNSKPIYYIDPNIQRGGRTKWNFSFAGLKNIFRR
eukprot:gene5451-6132_t